VHWRPVAVAAATASPARWRLGGTRERGGEQQQVHERVEGALVGENGRSDPRFAMAASNGAGGQHGERRKRWVCARCTARLGFIGGEMNRAITVRGHPALTRCMASNLDWRAQGRPAADRWTTPCADGGEGRDSTWCGRGLQGPRSAPNLEEAALGQREVALTPR
jgi:hypothetical protein